MDGLAQQNKTVHSKVAKTKTFISRCREMTIWSNIASKNDGPARACSKYEGWNLESTRFSLLTFAGHGPFSRPLEQTEVKPPEGYQPVIQGSLPSTVTPHIARSTQRN